MQILDRLGTGGVGTVYLARQADLDRLVAVKVLRRELTGNRLYVARLEREARLSMRLDHPNVVKGLYLGDVDGVPYFVMELVDGKSLKTILKERGRLEEDEVLEYGFQVARALDHAYRHGVVHRDIKPGNLILSRDGTVKLADLGLARRPDDSSVTRDGTTLGTPHYVSPEQARDPINADTRSDLYSLGATLFHAATGRPPFDAETVGGVLSQVLDENLVPELPDGVRLSKNLELLLRRLLSKDPARRYQTPDDLVRDLERVRRRERPNVSVFDVNPLAKKRIRRGILVGASALALCAAGFGIYYISSGASASKPVTSAEATAAMAAAAAAEPSLFDAAEAAGRLERLLRDPRAFSEKDRTAALKAQTRLDDRMAHEIDSLEKAARAAVDGALGAGEYASAQDAAQASLQAKIKETMRGRVDLLPERFSKRLERFGDGLSADVREAVGRAESSLTAAVPAHQEKLKATVDAELAVGKYASALKHVRGASADLATADGVQWSKLPLDAQRRVGDLLESKIGEARGRAERAIRGAAARVVEAAAAERDRLQRELELGRTGDAADRLRTFVTKALDEVHYGAEPWPADLCEDPGAKCEQMVGDLRRLESVRQAESMKTIFAEVDRLLLAALRDRRYSAAKQLWLSRADRTPDGAARAVIVRRIEFCERLADLRERARVRTDAKAKQKINIGLRAGGSAAGRITGTASEADDWSVKLDEGSPPQVRFSQMARADVDSLAGLASSAPDRLLRASFWCAEGEFDAAQSEIASLLAEGGDAESADKARMLAVDIDAWRVLKRDVATDRDFKLEMLLKRARDLAAAKELDLAQKAYDEVREWMKGLDASDPRAAELERELKGFESFFNEAARRRAEEDEFFGGRVRDRGDGSVDVTISTAGPLSPRIQVPPHWRRTAAGVETAAQFGVPDVVKSAPLTFPWPAALRAPQRLTVRLEVPLGRIADFCITALGRSTMLVAPRGRAPATALLRSGPIDALLDAPRRFGVDADFKPTSSLLRGGQHLVELAVDADGKNSTLILDGFELARGDQAGLGDATEIRAGGVVTIREIALSGLRK